MEKYIFYPAPHVFREIGKRGQITQRKDQDGDVHKKKNPLGPNSPVGHGSVEATIPTLRKDLELLRKSLPEILAQLQPFHIEAQSIHESEIDALFEEEEQHPKNRKRESSHYNDEQEFERRVYRRVEETHHARNEQPNGNLIPQFVRNWFELSYKEHEIGNIGLVPTPWQGNEHPTLQTFWNNLPEGAVLKHFCNYIKRFF